ncbi:MAG TPA: DUF5678 domain-containing protein [Terriglobia bacterium]|nr:DUF5678 domain-containing protein [Terriglobia bacterium]
MPAVKDLAKILADVPPGAWVAISSDEERVLSYDADFNEAMRKGKEMGEKEPIMIRVPEKDATLFL